MRYSRVLPALFITAALSIPTASAATLSADTEREMCVANNTENSAVVSFWNSLEDTVREQRLDELDTLDPGLKAAIESYIAQDADAPTAAELQVRLDNIGSGEGLAMLLPNDPTLADPNAEQSFKTEYTYDEAVDIINGFSDDPASGVLTQLQQAATTGTRTAEIRAEVFADRAPDYNESQTALKEDFQNCVDAIDDARPIPLQYILLGGAIALAVIVLAIRAWSNSRKTSKHSQ
ncbi:hypothetical protein [Corynebacterium suranareeae]|nr:hypothetical protein [Corynebacterium suranareeae]